MITGTHVNTYGGPNVTNSNRWCWSIWQWIG